MLIYIAAMWAMSAPAGYLVGLSYADSEGVSPDVLPFVSALLPPFSAVLAVTLILRDEIQ